MRVLRMVRKFCIVMSAFGCSSYLIIDLPKFSTVGNNRPEMIKDFASSMNPGKHIVAQLWPGKLRA